MSFSWRLYLTLAEHILDTAAQSGAPEAAYRSVASRAYYACLCRGRDFLVARGLMEQRDVTRERDSHVAVIRRLRRAAGPSRRFIGVNTDLLRNTRRHADYEAAPDFTADQAEKALEIANEVYKRLEALSTAS